MAALVLQKVLSFVYFTVLARNLGAESIGQYFFAISFATIFSVLIDLGLASVLIREVARQTEEWQRWFSQFFSLKLVLAIGTAIIITIVNQLFFASDVVKNYIYITTLIVVIDSFTLLFYAFIRGRQNLRFESLGTIIFQGIVFICGLVALKITKNVTVFLEVLLLASFFNFFYSAAILKRNYQIRFQLYFSKEFIKQIIRITLPFALAAIFAKVYAYIDTVFLKLFLGDREVGLYSVAYKLTFAFQFIPLAFVAALYPAFSSYFKTSAEQLKSLFVKSFNYLGFIALPLSAGIIALAGTLISGVYTDEFSSSVIPLQILIASIPFLFLNFTLSSLLNACEKQKVNTRNLGLVMALNIVLNLWLIPSIGILGASLASSLSTLSLFVLNYLAVKKVINPDWQLFKPLLLSLLSSVIMAAIVILLQGYIHWLILAVIGVVVYIVLMFAFRVLRKSDLVFFKSIVTRR